MMTKSMVESDWADEMQQFLSRLDPDIREITKSLEKIKSKRIRCSIVLNKTCLNNLQPRYKLLYIVDIIMNES